MEEQNSGMYISDGDSVRNKVLELIKRRCEQDPYMKQALDLMFASLIVELMVYRNNPDELKQLADRFCPIIKLALGIDLTGV